jgi:glycosyltransferase involved in cell wall biosynthesis
MKNKQERIAKDPIIIFAPHLEYPTRNGSDIYIDRLGCYLSKYKHTVQIVGAQTVTIYLQGQIHDQQEYENQPRSKTAAALRTILFRSHYLYEKFLTGGFQGKANEVYNANPEATLIYSFLFTSALNLPSDRQVVLTHNDEMLYYQSRIEHTRNPLAKLTGKLSQKWIAKLLAVMRPDTVLAHITEEDLKGYLQIIPEHKYCIIPGGVEIDPLAEDIPWDGRIRLMFCGSLSVNMNNDALNYFAENYYPKLKAAFKDNLDIWIVGSNPTQAVRELCDSNDWMLFPDLPDEELKEKYQKSAFSILPFQYSTGAKIKLLNSLSAGLPVLATRNMLIYPGQDFSPNLYSDDVDDWIEHIHLFEKNGISRSQKKACQKFTEQFSWDRIALDTDKILEKMLP